MGFSGWDAGNLNGTNRGIPWKLEFYGGYSADNASEQYSKLQDYRNGRYRWNNLSRWHDNGTCRRSVATYNQGERRILYWDVKVDGSGDSNHKHIGDVNTDHHKLPLNRKPDTGCTGGCDCTKHNHTARNATVSRWDWSFTIAASGTDLTYQWQIDRNDGKWMGKHDATAASYTTSTANISCNGFKYISVTQTAKQRVIPNTDCTGCGAVLITWHTE